MGAGEEECRCAISAQCWCGRSASPSRGRLVASERERNSRNNKSDLKKHDNNAEHKRAIGSLIRAPIKQSTGRADTPLKLLKTLLAIQVITSTCCESLLRNAGDWPQTQTQRAAASISHAKRPARRPESSSSIESDLEDLNDSSVRTRLGTVTIEHLGTAPDDFDWLIEKIVTPPAGGSSSSSSSKTSGHQQANYPAEANQRVSADANNKTTMRFFRNSKTFASIVYTNQMIEDGRRLPRRLINCHLVDLEKHASDVAIYETKYDIQTVDIEFKEMMQLLEACTNIARLRRRPPNNIGQQPGAPGSQYVTSGSAQAASSQSRPLVVVGPPPASAPLIGSSPQTTPKPTLQNNEQAVFHEVMSNALNREFAKLNTSPASPQVHHLELPHTPFVFTEMHNHNNGLNININIGRSSGASTTRKPQHFHSQTKRKRHQPLHSVYSQRGRFDPIPVPQLYANISRHSQKLFQRQQHQHQHQSGARQLSLTGGGGNQLQRHPLVGALAKVGEQSKRLVLGEVTVPPTLFSNLNNNNSNLNMSSNATSGIGGSGLREALQEISSYDTSDLLSIWRGILPGTNWCGMGDRATSYNDLGFESDIDICCRAHDFCPVRLAAFTSGYGLFNWSFYTRSHCWCDQNFLDCLQQAESPLSAVVMKFYFSIMKTTCLNDIETDQQQTKELKGGAGAGGGKQQTSGSSARNAPTNANNNNGGHFQGPPIIAALKRSRWLQTARNERPTKQ